MVFFVFKGLRQCADPFRWLLHSRGFEKNYMSAVSTAKTFGLEELEFEDLKRLCINISIAADQFTSLII